MIPTINKNDKALNIDFRYKFKNATESDTYEATYKGKPVITKFFTNKSCIGNKVNKMILIKERCKSIDLVVTADAFIEEDGKIIGYMMPKIEGINLDYNSLNFKRKPQVLISYLKGLAINLKQLHQLGIIAGDYTHNTIVKDGKIYFIDHDNFAIDNYKVDKMNRFMMKYVKKTKRLDKNFDFYLLNLYTFATLRHYCLTYIYETYDMNRDLFNFRDEEIREIFKKTIKLDDSFNEELIIDKINSAKDLKKIKPKF